MVSRKDYYFKEFKNTNDIILFKKAIDLLLEYHLLFLKLERIDIVSSNKI
jgi:hypothetical protein